MNELGLFWALVVSFALAFASLWFNSRGERLWHRHPVRAKYYLASGLISMCLTFTIWIVLIAYAMFDCGAPPYDR